MNNFSVFNSVSEEQFSELCSCVCAENKTFAKNDIIIRHTNDCRFIGIVRRGMLYLLSISEDGEKSIIDYYEKGSVFGKEFTPDSSVNLHYVVAKEDCEITLFQYDRLMNCCSNNCEKHRSIINSIVINSLKRCQMHIDILSGRSIRRKLTAYFRYMTIQSSSDEFDIPISLSDLADYLSVDRSAMMRELKKMKSDNLIDAKSCHITVIDL